MNSSQVMKVSFLQNPIFTLVGSSTYLENSKIEIFWLLGADSHKKPKNLKHVSECLGAKKLKTMI